MLLVITFGVEVAVAVGMAAAVATVAAAGTVWVDSGGTVVVLNVDEGTEEVVAVEQVGGGTIVEEAAMA